MGYGNSIRIEAPFAEGTARVRDALKAQGFGVLTEIDMRATLRAVTLPSARAGRGPAPGYRRDVSSVTMSAADCRSFASATPCPAHIESASI